MAIEAGGRGDKDGNEFERLWVVHCALEVVTGRANWLKWEPPPGEAEGGDLVLARARGQELHQCKIGNQSVGKWSVADLSERVLANARTWLTGGVGRQFHFISRDRVVPLEDLADRARRFDGDQPGFVGSLSLADTKELLRLASTWHCDWNDAAGRGRVIELLRQLHFGSGFRTADPRLEALAASAFVGRGSEIVDRIGSIVFGWLGQVVYADELRKAMSTAGFRSRDLRLDPSVSAGIERLRDAFLRDLEASLIGHSLVARSASRDAIALVTGDEPPKGVLLVGRAGAGKSAVLFETAKELLSQGIPFLPVRLDVDRPEEDLLAFSIDKLGLPFEPVACLASMAGERRSVLILDQLDAIRWTAAHAAKAMQVVQELLERAGAVPSMTVLGACRTFDLDDDRRLLALFPERTPRIDVGELPENAVLQIVQSCGVDPNLLPTPELTLLRNAFTLALWVDIAVRGPAPQNFSNRTDLLRNFWAEQRKRIREEHGVPDSETGSVLDKVVAFLDQQGRLDAPDLVTQDHPGAAKALFSLGLLQQRGGRLRFAHQAHADYLIAVRVAQRVVTEGLTLVEWATRDQSLFRRQQVRQILELLRDTDATKYSHAIVALLTSPSVRFHLTQLAVGVLRQATDPTLAEIEAISAALEAKPLRRFLCQHLLSSSPPWTRAMLRRGLFLSWLGGGDPEDRRLAVQVLGTCSGTLGDELAGVLDLARKGPAEDVQRDLVQLLPADASSDSPLLFALRLELAATVGWFAAGQLAHLSELLVPREPSKALRLFHSALRGALHRIREPAKSDSGLLLAMRKHDGPQKIHAAFAVCPQEALDLFLPLLHAVTDIIRPREQHPEEGIDRYDWHGVHTTLLEGLELAAGELARLSQESALQLIQRLAPSEDFDRIAANAWLELPAAAFADRCIEWLLSGDGRLVLARDSHDEAWVAADLVARFGDHCSIPLYEQLESAVVSIRSPWELDSLRKQLEGIRERPARYDPLMWGGRPLNHYGSLQQVVLEALPVNRLSLRAGILKACWRSKFGIPSRPVEGEMIVGSVESPIPASYLMRIPDSQWRSIARGDWKRRGRYSRQKEPEIISERSHETFAASFGDAARRNPRRFASLALQLNGPAAAGYVRSTLWAVGDPARPANAVLEWEPASTEAIERLAARGEELDRSDSSMAVAFCFAVDKRTAETWSNEAVDRLAHYAETAKDPEPDKVPLRTRRDGEPARDDLSSTALNSARGAAVYALGRLSAGNSVATPRTLQALHIAANDPNAAVRVAVQGAATALLTLVPEESVALFLAACNHEDDRVLASYECRRFVRRAWRAHIAELVSTLQRMIGSGIAAAAQLGAECVTAAWLYDKQLGELFRLCASGAPPQRAGVAAVAVGACTGDEEPSSESLAWLTRSLQDPDPSVSSKAAAVFSRDGFLEKKVAPSLAADYARSAAFVAEPSALVGALAREPIQVGRFLESIGTMASRFWELSGSTVSWNLDGELTTLILGLYESTTDTSIRGACLDAFDSLLMAGSPRIQRHLDSLDRT